MGITASHPGTCTRQHRFRCTPNRSNCHPRERMSYRYCRSRCCARSRNRWCTRCRGFRHRRSRPSGHCKPALRRRHCTLQGRALPQSPRGTTRHNAREAPPAAPSRNVPRERMPSPRPCDARHHPPWRRGDLRAIRRPCRHRRPSCAGQLARSISPRAESACIEPSMNLGCPSEPHKRGIRSARVSWQRATRRRSRRRGRVPQASRD